MFLKIWKEIKNKKFAPLYLLYGKEEFLIEETKNLIIREALEDDTIDLNLNTYDMEEINVAAAIEDCETIPFFGERKIVIVQNPFFLTAEKGKEKIEHDLPVLENYITNPVPTTILIIIAPYEKLDERKRLTKALKKQAVVLDAQELSEKDTIQWIRQYIDERGGKIQLAAAEKIFQMVGPHLGLIHHELNKLLLYADDVEIDDMMVEELVARSLEENIFSLVDHVVKKRLDHVLEIYSDLLKLNEEPIKITALIASQLRLLYQVKTLLKKGYSQNQIASRLKVHPYRVKLAMGKAKQFSLQKILEMLEDLAEIDYQMKTGGGDKEKLLELFFVKHIH